MTLIHPKTQLGSHGLSAKHQFGQNFLSDPSLCNKIASHAVPDGTRTVIEIGAGLGALTSSLLARDCHVVAIERDRDLVPLLAEQFAEALETSRLQLVEADAKTFDYEAIYRNQDTPATLCGNLPYQLTGPLLRRAIELAPLISRACFLVQLEVADRLVSKPDSDDYGALAVFVQARFRVERAFVVRRGAFFPQPKVDSAVVVLTPLAAPVSEETPVFQSVVKSAFAQRRKKLRNAWSQLGGGSRDVLESCAARVGIDLELRGEVLTVAQFAAMAQELARQSATSP